MFWTFVLISNQQSPEHEHKSGHHKFYEQLYVFNDSQYLEGSFWTR